MEEKVKRAEHLAKTWEPFKELSIFEQLVVISELIHIVESRAHYNRLTCEVLGK
jgi:hypothetical protein